MSGQGDPRHEGAARRVSRSAGRALNRVVAPLRGLLPLVLVLGVWQLRGSPDSPFFPAPSTWFPALGDLWTAGLLLPAIIATLRTFAVALLTATVVGTVVGILVGVSRRADQASGPTFEFARAMPPAAMVPIATLLLGFQETMKVTVVTFAAVWAILLNARIGVRSLHPTLLDSARSLRLGPVDRVRKIVVPALLPSILLGVRVAAPIAVVITLLVEILTRVNGVGGLIAQAQATFRPARVYGLIVVAGVISLIVNGLVGALQTVVVRRRRG